MKGIISYSDSILMNQNVERNIEKLMEYGADAVEIVMEGEFWEDAEDKGIKFADSLKRFPVEYTVHPPVYDINFASCNKSVRKAAFTEYTSAILFAHEIEASYVVLHPGYLCNSDFDRHSAVLRAEEAINKLNRIAGPLGVQLAVENIGSTDSSLYSEEEFSRALDGMDSNLGYLIDVGHAHINGWNTAKLIQKVKSRLLGLHLHDNSGKSDEHFPVGDGTIEWMQIIQSLKNTDLDYKLVLEYRTGINPQRLMTDRKFLAEHLIAND